MINERIRLDSFHRSFTYDLLTAHDTGTAVIVAGAAAQALEVLLRTVNGIHIALMVF